VIPSSLTDIFSKDFATLGVRPGMTLTGLPGTALPLVALHLSSSTGKPLILSFLNDEEALVLHDVLTTDEYAGVVFYPGPSSLDGVPAGFSSPMENFRYRALVHLGLGDPPAFLLCSNPVLSEGLPSSESLKGKTLQISAGHRYNTLRAWLEDNRYEPVALVTDPGTYALRGGVIDIFPANDEAPVRLDFLDDELQEIREFDIHSQISTAKRSAVVVLSLVEEIYGNTPVFNYFPAGWVLMLQTAEDSWEVISADAEAPERTLSLAFDSFASRAFSPELVQERWRLLKRRKPDAKAWFVSERTDTFSRARKLLPAIPLVHVAGHYLAGFSSSVLGALLLTPTEVFQQPITTWKSKRKRAPSAATVRQHIDHLEPHDPIVHVDHGVGRYLGLTDLKVAGATQECLLIEYKGGDKIYVSTDKISLVFPYTAKDDQYPELDSLRSTRWERVKRQTRRSAEEIVDRLAELYAQRSLAKGVAQPADDDLQMELEATFPYEDTDDQIQATREIKDDMEQPLPMDRLLCGDVGFGKTEVALRAAFKAIRGSGQVALLAPTTILADQHYISFKARLEPFAVKVRMLSRFVSRKAQKDVIHELASGQADLVIGTHRLLSKDIEFNNLTLLIVDEEHRFGVKHKDRIKELKHDLDVLSLSATPIPRTLHFSLAGIRDISRLDTPPRERIPIITSIHYYDPPLIKKAVIKELGRGGQVYFVHNEVKSIYRVEQELRNILPEVSIAVAHGQMAGKQLEETMLAFSDGRFQLLLCTSIIESGIDLPNVNTVLINDAHKLGLAQIYQIRGRVGRSNRQAYAFLLIRQRPKLTSEATKRLKTIERHSALGSGYSIALKDLEIRGAGNLFGLEQSGHVAAVGLDLYTKIIQGIIREKQLQIDGGDVSKLAQEEVTVRVFPNVSIPEHYIDDPHLRLNLYRRIASLTGADQVDDIWNEFRDRFGPPVQEVENLLETARLRTIAARIGIRTVKTTDYGGLLLDFVVPSESVELLNRIQRGMDIRGYDYRFHNLKNGDLRVSITEINGAIVTETMALFNALGGTH